MNATSKWPFIPWLIIALGGTASFASDGANTE